MKAIFEIDNVLYFKFLHQLLLLIRDGGVNDHIANLPSLFDILLTSTSQDVLKTLPYLQEHEYMYCTYRLMTDDTMYKQEDMHIQKSLELLSATLYDKKFTSVEIIAITTQDWIVDLYKFITDSIKPNAKLDVHAFASYDEKYSYLCNSSYDLLISADIYDIARIVKYKDKLDVMIPIYGWTSETKIEETFPPGINVSFFDVFIEDYLEEATKFNGLKK